MLKAMYMDTRNIEGDDLAGYFDSEESFIKAIEEVVARGNHLSYGGTEMYGGKKCYVINYKIRDSVDKTRYYLVKIENGWV